MGAPHSWGRLEPASTVSQQKIRLAAALSANVKIDGARVVSNDGLHAPTDALGTFDLSRSHPHAPSIEIRYWQQPFPPMLVTHCDDLSSYQTIVPEYVQTKTNYISIDTNVVPAGRYR
jgi:hypothetical protein